MREEVIDESFEPVNTRIIDLLLEQQRYLKEEVQYYRDEFVRMQELLLGSRVESGNEVEDEARYEPVHGILTPSAKRSILERAARKIAREKIRESLGKPNAS